MRRRKAKKPHILKHKAEVVNLIKQTWSKKSYAEHEPTKGYYWWRGEFYSENGVHVYIYFQRYVSKARRGAIDYIHLRYNGGSGRALTPTEIKELLNKLKDEK